MFRSISNGGDFGHCTTTSLNNIDSDHMVVMIVTLITINYFYYKLLHKIKYFNDKERKWPNEMCVL